MRTHARIHTHPRARALWIAFALVGFGRQILQVRAGGPGALAGARVGQHVSAVDGRLLGDTDEEQAGEARLASALPGERVSLEVLFAAAATARWQCDVLLEHSVQSTPCDRAACRMQRLHSNMRRAACRMQRLLSNVAACCTHCGHFTVALLRAS